MTLLLLVRSKLAKIVKIYWRWFPLTWELVPLVCLLLDDELNVPEVEFELELILELLPELAKVEVPLLLHPLHHQLHLQDLQTFEITVRSQDHGCNFEKASAKKTWVVRSSIWVMSSWGSLPSGREVAGRPLPPWPTPEIKLLTLANPCAVSYQTFNMKRKCNPLVRSCFVNEDRFVSSDVYHKRPRTHFLNFHAARCNRVTSLDPNHA